MNQCTNRDIGELLHAYELGILDDQDQRKFETHLMTCNHCFEEANELMPAVMLLNRASEVRDVAREAVKLVREDENSRKSIFDWLFSMPLVRYAAAAAILIAVAVPVMRYSLLPSSPDQEIFLSPVRSSDNVIVNLETGGEVAFNFVMTGTSEKSECEVSIYSRNGDTVFSDDSFVGFDEEGQAAVQLDASVFTTGIYVLSISGCSTSKDSVRQYYFMVR